MPMTPMNRRAVLAACGAGLARPAGATRLTFGGTGAPLSMLAALAEVFAGRGGMPFDLVPSLGSSGGLRAIEGGRIAIAIALPDPRPSAGSDAVVSTVFARTPLVPVGHRHCGIGMLTSEQAGRLLTAESRAWPNGMTARTVFRPPSEREWNGLRTGRPEIARAADFATRQPGELIARNSHQNAELLESVEGAFGLMPLGQVLSESRQVRVIGLDGAFPSISALQEGRWPLSLTFHIAIRADAPREVRDFVDFLRGEQATRLLASMGFIGGGASGP